MKLKTLVITTILTSLVSAAAFSQANLSTNIPHLEKRGTATQLIVDGKPFLVIGAELNNSSASSVEYMQPLCPRSRRPTSTPSWPRLWELTEPEEGRFDFNLVDSLIQGARRQNLH